MLLDHVGQGVVDQVEGGVQLGAHADLPVLRLHLLDVARPGSGGVVDQDVQAAPLLNGGVHQLLAVLQLGDVGVDREGFAPGGDDVGVGVDGLGGGFRVPDDGGELLLVVLVEQKGLALVGLHGGALLSVVGDDLAALGGHPDRQVLANALTGAGDDRYAPF